MNLGFHYHTPAFIGPNGKIFTAGYLGVFLDSLAAEFESLACFLHEPLDSEISKMDYELKASNVKLISIGPHFNLAKRLILTPGKVKAIGKEINAVDVLLIRAPTPMVNHLFLQASKHKRAVALLLVGDYVESAKELRTFFLKKYLIQCFSFFNERRQRKIIQNALVFVNSRLLFEKYKNFAKEIVEIRTTTLSEKDFNNRSNTCASPHIQLLYTGRIDLAKGLMEMVEALIILNEKHLKFILNIVGWEEKENEPVKNVLLEKARSAGQENQIVFHGKKSIGNELNKFYRMADIYLIASKGSEGFPRTIWEAMANGLPVVASEIGSIPFYLSNYENALFIKPGDIIDIVDKVQVLVEDNDLRKKLIFNGYALAKGNTLDVQAKNIKVNIEKFFSDAN